MWIRLLLVVLATLIAVSAACADVPSPDGRPRPPRRQYFPLEVPPLPKMTVSRDPSAKSVTLILPDNLVTALQPAVLPRVASTGSATLVGLALVGSLVAGGLWLARLPRAKYLVGVMIPLLGLALVNSVVQAQSARLDPPRAVVETGKVRISRGSPGQIQLILPARAPAK